MSVSYINLVILHYAIFSLEINKDRVAPYLLSRPQIGFPFEGGKKPSCAYPKSPHEKGEDDHYEIIGDTSPTSAHAPKTRLF